MTPLNECDYICAGCGERVCMDHAPSPSEVESICADCFDTEIPAEVPC